jgi:amylosucrase
MTHVLGTHFPEGFRRACFATYLRCHDDIGWAITPEDTAPFPPMTDWGHRAFLADFYNGSFPGSFARGADFQSDAKTGDRRTNGTLASLAGLEAATTPQEEELAIARILMGHGLIASFGGIPLLYMGDEIGLLNDHGYLADPDLATDGRWMHRPAMDWAAVATIPGGVARAARIHAGIRAIMAARKATPQLASQVPTRVRDTGHPRLFVFDRLAEDRPVTCLFNFTEGPQAISPWALRLDPARDWRDALTGAPLVLTGGEIGLPAYGQLWLMPG